MKKPLRYQLQPLSILTIVLEVAFIIVCGFFFSRHLQDWSPNIMYGGRDYPSAMHQTSFVWAVFKEYGFIPLWNPFIGFGEPMLENLASSAMNPLIILPALLFGPVQGGKVALFMHIIFLAIGGWLLARVLRADWPGRVLAGLLFVGSGSIVAQFGTGFIHLAYPQVYIPYALAGLIGTLYLRRRWPLVMLAVAVALMPYSGGFWYMLPTAISAVFICAFALLGISVKPSFSLNIDWEMAGRLTLATAFTVGLLLMRFLPLQMWLVYHPNNWATPGSDFMAIVNNYFAPVTSQPQASDIWINYHYVLPWAFVIALVGARLFIFRPADTARQGVWRLLLGGGIAWGIITFWAQGDIPIIRDLYKAFPLLENWKNSGRIAAGATPWIIMVAALWFDDVIFILMQIGQRRPLLVGKIGPLAQLKLTLNRLILGRGMALVLVVGLLFGGFLASADVLSNWSRLVYLMYTNEGAPDEELGLDYLRAIRPNNFLSVLTQGWITHFAFVNNFGRTTHGDATIFTLGLPSTLGTDTSMGGHPQYAVGANLNYVGWLKDNGYEAVPGAPQINDTPTVWQNGSAVPYAFLVDKTFMQETNWRALTNRDVSAVAYNHLIDTVRIVLPGYKENSVLIISETAYPGWQATINGTALRWESVGGRLALVLPPATVSPTVIEFAYRPPALFFGQWIMLFTVLASVGYLLKIDKRIPVSFRQRVVRVVGQRFGKVYAVLTKPGLLDPEPNFDLPALPSPKTPMITAGGAANVATNAAANGHSNGAKPAPEIIAEAEIVEQ
jgi:hypothetical protein